MSSLFYLEQFVGPLQVKRIPYLRNHLTTDFVTNGNNKKSEEKPIELTSQKSQTTADTEVTSQNGKADPHTPQANGSSVSQKMAQGGSENSIEKDNSNVASITVTIENETVEKNGSEGNKNESSTSSDHLSREVQKDPCDDRPVSEININKSAEVDNCIANTLPVPGKSTDAIPAQDDHNDDSASTEVEDDNTPVHDVPANGSNEDTVPNNDVSTTDVRKGTEALSNNAFPGNEAPFTEVCLSIDDGQNDSVDANDVAPTDAVNGSENPTKDSFPDENGPPSDVVISIEVPPNGSFPCNDAHSAPVDNTNQAPCNDSFARYDAPPKKGGNLEDIPANSSFADNDAPPTEVDINTEVPPNYPLAANDVSPTGAGINTGATSNDYFISNDAVPTEDSDSDMVQLQSSSASNGTLQIEVDNSDVVHRSEFSNSNNGHHTISISKQEAEKNDTGGEERLPSMCSNKVIEPHNHANVNGIEPAPHIKDIDIEKSGYPEHTSELSNDVSMEKKIDDNIKLNGQKNTNEMVPEICENSH